MPDTRHTDTHPARSTFLDRQRGVLMRVGALIAIVIAIIIGVRNLLDSGPDEKYRIVHPSGYSVVHPRDWDAGRILTPDNNGFIDAISMWPKNWKGQQPSMWVRRYARPPDLNKIQSMGFQQREFQGQPVWMQQSQPRTHLLRTAIFQRGDSWYNLSVALPGLEGAKVEDYWRYIETFRTQRGEAVSGMPTTSPATNESP